MQDNVDVLIVGCGPIGMFMANLLGQANISTLVVERNATLSDVPRAVALDDEGMRVLQQIDLVNAIAPHMLLGYDHRLYGRKGKLLLTIDPSNSEYGYPKRNRFHQPELERHLLEGLNRFDCAEVGFATEVTDIELTAKGARVEVTQNDIRSVISARYVIGCDGGTSTIRETLGIDMIGTSHPEPWIVVDTENNEDTARYSRAFGDPKRPAVSVPGTGGRRRYEFMLLPGEDKTEAVSDVAIRKLLKPHCNLARVAIKRRAVYTFHSLVAQRFSEQECVFLAGDAAHMMPPFQGQGMNAGVRDAFNLAWKLIAVINGRLGMEILRTYEQERRKHVLDMIQLSRRVGQVLMTRGVFSTLLRDFSFALLKRIPAIHSYFSQMRFKPKPAPLSGYFLPQFPLVGKLFPQPDVWTWSGRQHLDAVLGGGFALLHLSDKCEAQEDEFTHRYWRDIEARRIMVLPGGLVQPPEYIDEIVADIGGAIANAIGIGSPVAVLLRPDRVVAAVIRPGEANAVAEALDAMAPTDRDLAKNSHQEERAPLVKKG